MKLRNGFAPLILIALLAGPALPCTAFLVCGDDSVLMGNNEDYWNPNVRIWFVPATKGRLGRVFLGYENLYPQGGMNEAGLAFDGFATERFPLQRQEGKELFEGNLIDEVMATCATVEEAITWLSRHDLRLLENAMLMFCDKTGDSVIVEGDEFVRKAGSFQVVTNFYQSRQTNDRAMCPRFDAAVGMLENASRVDLALCRRVLARTAQEGGAPTQYSNVFDLKKGLIHLYHFHNFEEVVAFDLAEELKKGEHVLKIPDLFPPTFAYRTFLKKREREQADEIRRRRGEPVDPQILDEYAGRYAIEIPGVGRITAHIRRDGARLLASSKGEAVRDEEREIELIPQSREIFFHVADQGTTEVRFVRGEDGAVSGIVVKGPLGNEVRGSRIE